MKYYFTAFVTFSLIILLHQHSVAQSACPNNLVSNPGFNINTNVFGDGSMPGSSTDSWSAACGTPQIYNFLGCYDANSISAWGNDAVGEAVCQTLVTPLLANHTYTLTFCASWTKSATPQTAPQLVRLRLRGSNTIIPDFTCSSGCQELVVSADITDTVFQSYSYTFTPVEDWSIITLNPQNGSSILDGAYVSWINFDNICITESVSCTSNNLVTNGGFNLNTVIFGDGSMPSSSTDAWQRVGSSSPQLYGFVGCEDVTSVSMWGNDAVGEGIWQHLNSALIAGEDYSFSFCASWIASATPSTAPQHTNVRLRGSNAELPDIYCSGSCQELVLSSDITDTSWQTYSYPFTPTGNWDYITISPNNGSSVLDGAYVSWLGIDNVCIMPAHMEGVDNTIAGAETFTIFPNPSDGGITLRTNIHTHCSVKIFNAVGVLVYAGNETVFNTPVQLAIARGIYAVQIMGDNHSITKMLVIQ